ncbi:MAG: glycosyltransferase [Lachnospiraceae bacterium]|nr:glycosyltransferase [Lachnospiraceae bacterium]
MTVLFLRSNPVNPDSRVEKEIAVLLGLGYKVSVFAWDRNASYPVKAEPLNDALNDVTAYRVGIPANYGSGIRNIKPLLAFQKAIRRFLKTHTFDVIHACDFDTAYTAYHIIDRKKTKFIYDVFDYYADAFRIPSILRPAVVRADRKILNGADAVFLCTEKRKEQIGTARPKKLVIIHNAPPETERSEHTVRSGNSVRLAYFGILAEGRMIRELCDIVANDPRLELHIGGFGYLEDEVRRFSDGCDRIVFYGRTPYDQVLRAESDSDLLTAIYDPAVRNHYYAAPNKFYEALMLGKPLIMVHGTGMSEVVEEHDLGEVIPYSYEGLKNGLDRLIDRRSEWERMSGEMTELYRSSYSWSEMAKRIESVYRNLELEHS